MVTGPGCGAGDGWQNQPNNRDNLFDYIQCSLSLVGDCRYVAS